MKIKLLEKLSEHLFVNNDTKDKQISRLGGKEISYLTTMEATDDILGFPFYRPFAKNWRVLKISLNGLSRKELIKLVESLTKDEGGYNESSNPEKRGILDRIFNRNFA